MLSALWRVALLRVPRGARRVLTAERGETANSHPTSGELPRTVVVEVPRGTRKLDSTGEEQKGAPHCWGAIRSGCPFPQGGLGTTRECLRETLAVTGSLQAFTSGTAVCFIWTKHRNEKAHLTLLADEKHFREGLNLTSHMQDICWPSFLENFTSSSC